MARPNSDAACYDPFASDKEPRFALQSMADVETRPVEWLWPNLIPFGKLTTVEGDPECGKSLFTMDIAARITSGRRMPNGAEAAPCAVLLICDEDDYEDTIAPRLKAAGANLSLIYALFVLKNEAGEVQPFVIPDDMPVLEQKIGELQALTDISNVLVVVDPATSYLSEKINSNNDASVRKAMSPLAMLARDTGAAILLVRHLNKNSGEKNHKYRGGGSIAFFAAARASLMFGPHPDDPDLMVMAQAKKNIAKPMPSLGYRIVSCDEDSEMPLIQWEGAVDVDAHTVLGGRDSRTVSPDRDEAKTALLDMLDAADGAVIAGDAIKECGGLGLSPSTVKRAANELGLVKERVRDESGKVASWLWRRPVQGSKIRIQGHARNQGTPESPEDPRAHGLADP